MYTTYHFQSAAEVNADIIESIKIAFKGKSIVITVEEEQVLDNQIEDVPEWQKEIVLARQKYYNENPHELIEWEEAKKMIRTR